MISGSANNILIMKIYQVIKICREEYKTFPALLF